MSYRHGVTNSKRIPRNSLNAIPKYTLSLPPLVVYVPALKQGPATVGSEVLMRVGLAAALVSLCY